MPKLSRIGDALYGPRWQSDLARALGVSDRTMRRWAAVDEMPPQYQPAVGKLIKRRIKALQSTYLSLTARADQMP